MEEEWRRLNAESNGWVYESIRMYILSIHENTKEFYDTINQVWRELCPLNRIWTGPEDTNRYKRRVEAAEVKMCNPDSVHYKKARKAHTKLLKRNLFSLQLLKSDLKVTSFPNECRISSKSEWEEPKDKMDAVVRIIETVHYHTYTYTSKARLFGGDVDIMGFCEDIMVFENNNSNGVRSKMLSHVESIMVEIFGPRFISRSSSVPDCVTDVVLDYQRVKSGMEEEEEDPDKELVAGAIDRQEFLTQSWHTE